uniref:ZIM n=1 Tax=Medicago truncatula TaxID=3880 RepID=A4PRH9_MEDTR|nr:ZIM [Medicago truncatula]
MRVSTTYYHFQEPCVAVLLVRYESVQSSLDDSKFDVVYGNGGENHEFTLQRFDESDQFTLSFRDQVYVFNYVTPSKVQLVLLLFDRCEQLVWMWCLNKV